MVEYMVNRAHRPRASDLEGHNIVFIVGRPASGKTHLLKHLINIKINQGLDSLYVFSPNVHEFTMVAPQYKTAVYEDDKLQRIKNAVKSLDKNLVVFDDVVGFMKFNSDVVKNVFSTHRHLNMTIIVCTQYMNTIPPHIREMGSVVYIFPTESMRALNAMHQSYFGMFPTWHDFGEFLNKHLKTHEALMYKPRENLIKKIRAPR